MVNAKVEHLTQVQKMRNGCFKELWTVRNRVKEVERKLSNHIRVLLKAVNRSFFLVFSSGMINLLIILRQTKLKMKQLTLNCNRGFSIGNNSKKSSLGLRSNILNPALI